MVREVEVWVEGPGMGDRAKGMDASRRDFRE